MLLGKMVLRSHPPLLHFLLASIGGSQLRVLACVDPILRVSPLPMYRELGLITWGYGVLVAAGHLEVRSFVDLAPVFPLLDMPHRLCSQLSVF